MHHLLVKSNLFTLPLELCTKISNRISEHNQINKEPKLIILTCIYNDRKLVLGIETIYESVWFSACYFKQYVELYSLIRRVEEVKIHKDCPQLSKIMLKDFDLEYELESLNNYVKKEWPEILHFIIDNTEIK